VLDQRVALNGIIRQGGTYSYLEVDVTADRALNLIGLNTSETECYSITDDSGNIFYLEEDYSFAVAGTQTLTFRAKEIGAVSVLANTVTTPVTIVLGVTAVNNPSVVSTLGADQETDSELKIRRIKSVAINAQGYLTSLLAEILNVETVETAIVYENTTDTVDSDGIPAHGAWCIVEGGTDALVAEAIYNKRNAGCAMAGAVEVDILQVDGTLFTVKFDRPSSEDIHIQFSITPIGDTIIESSYLKSSLIANLVPTINQTISGSTVAAEVLKIYPNSYVTLSEVSYDGATWEDVLTPTTKDKRFLLDAANIDITIL
jgi:hypothetical protein